MGLFMHKAFNKKNFLFLRSFFHSSSLGRTVSVLPSIGVLKSVTPSAIRKMMLKKVSSCSKCHNCLHFARLLDTARTLHTLGTKMVKCLPRKAPMRLKHYLKQYLSTVKIDMDWHSCKKHSRDVLEMLIDSACDVSIAYSRVVLY